MKVYLVLRKKPVVFKLAVLAVFSTRRLAQKYADAFDGHVVDLTLQDHLNKIS